MYDNKLTSTCWSLDMLPTHHQLCVVCQPTGFLGALPHSYQSPMAILKRKELLWHVLLYRILSTPTKEKGKSPLWMKGLIYRHAVLLITGLILLLCRWHIMGSSTPVFQVVDNPASFEKSFIMRVSETPVLRCSTIKYHSQGCWMLIS